MTTPSIRHLFDLDITLRDAALDMENQPTRRMIANAAIGIHVEDAYYSVRELREAEEARDRLAKAARLAGTLGAVGLRGGCGAPVEARGLGAVGKKHLVRKPLRAGQGPGKGRVEAEAEGHLAVVVVGDLDSHRERVALEEKQGDHRRGGKVACQQPAMLMSASS